MAEEESLGDQQKPPPGEAAAMVRYPVAEVAEAVAFLGEIEAGLVGDPGVRDELLGLLGRFGEGRVDARFVRSRAAGLLREHPDVLDRFAAFLSGARAPVPVPAEGIAATRPRRSSTRWSGRGSRRRSVPAEAGPGVAGVGHALPLKSGAAGASTSDDPRLREGLAFQRRVKEEAGSEILGKFLSVLHAGDTYADEVHSRVGEAFGPAHDGLLREFAGTFLPGLEEWEAHQARRLARQQRRAAAAGRKIPPADGADRRRGAALCAGESSGAGAATRSEFDRDVACTAVKKKRHADDGDRRGHALRVGECSGGARGHGHGHDHDDYAPRCRTKKPRADDGGGVSRGEPSVLDAGDHGLGDKKKPRRRAPNGGEGSSAAAASPGDDKLFRQFREMWVFSTHYSTLVDTMARAEELLLAAAAGGGLPASVEELFPRRESREFLKNYYAGHWGIMRAALEGGESTRPALEAVLESLARKEEEAVAEEVRERRRRDSARAAERLGGLVADRVRREAGHRRQDASDGGASGQHAGARAPRRGQQL